MQSIKETKNYTSGYSQYGFVFVQQITKFRACFTMKYLKVECNLEKSGRATKRQFILHANIDFAQYFATAWDETFDAKKITNRAPPQTVQSRKLHHRADTISNLIIRTFRLATCLFKKCVTSPSTPLTVVQ
jgi:hypothetical protein